MEKEEVEKEEEGPSAHPSRRDEQEVQTVMKEHEHELILKDCVVDSDDDDDNGDDDDDNDEPR